MNTVSIWKDTSEEINSPSIEGDQTVDVVIIGGGIKPEALSFF
jgi:hypothetical protein